MLKTIISAWPAGLPLAQKISDVAPTRDAASVSQFVRSKMQKDTTISATDEHHKVSSPALK